MRARSRGDPAPCRAFLRAEALRLGQRDEHLDPVQVSQCKPDVTSAVSVVKYRRLEMSLMASHASGCRLSTMSEVIAFGPSGTADACSTAF